MLTASASDRDPVGRSLTVPAGEVGARRIQADCLVTRTLALMGMGWLALPSSAQDFPTTPGLQHNVVLTEYSPLRQAPYPPPGCLNPVLTLPRTTSNTVLRTSPGLPR